MKEMKPYYFEHPQYGKMRVMMVGDKMFVYCYCADGVFLLSDNSEVMPIDVRFNGRVLTINDQIFD